MAISIAESVDGPDQHVLVSELKARVSHTRIDTDDPGAVLPGPLEILERAGSEVAITWAPTPHDDQTRVGVVNALTAGALVVRFRAIRVPDCEDFGLSGEIRPELGAPTGQIKKSLQDHTIVEQGRIARPGSVQYRGRTVGLADAAHLTGDLVERIRPRDPLPLIRAPRARPPHRMQEPLGVIDTIQGAESAYARGEGRHRRCPLARIRADTDDAPILDVGVHDAATAAIVTASARNDFFAGSRRNTGRFVDRLGGHRASLGRGRPLPARSGRRQEITRQRARETYPEQPGFVDATPSPGLFSGRRDHSRPFLRQGRRM
jgi:hypothetical protein